MSKRTVRLCVLAVLLVSLVFGFSAAALAQEKVEYAPIYYMEGADTGGSEAVLLIQQKLWALGYFDESYTPGVMDIPTLDAIRRFCEVNGLQQPGDMIDVSTQRIIREGAGIPRPTDPPASATPVPADQPTPFPVVKKGERNEQIVGPVQLALSEKGYFTGIEGNFTLGFFDDPTEEALRRFCEETMHFAYNPADGISELLFTKITDKDLKPYATPGPTEFSLIGYTTNSEDVRLIQVRLTELGYFRDYGQPTPGYYGQVTQQAVSRFCAVNKIPPNPAGIDPEFYNRLMDEKALPNPAERKDIMVGERNDALPEIQERLFSLGYYKTGQRTGVFDPDMDAAVRVFADINQIEYDGRTMTVALQNALFSEQARPYSPELDKTLAAEKEAEQGLSGSVNFLGIRMPVFVMILLIILVLAGLAFLVIRVFFNTDKSGADAGASDLYTPASSSSGSGPQLTVDIRFQGSSRTATVNMDKPLRIGRTERTLPLDNDSDISRQHCQMSFRGNVLILRDYSTNGTEVNGQVYHNCECVIHSGDTIKIGRHELTVRF